MQASLGKHIKSLLNLRKERFPLKNFKEQGSWLKQVINNINFYYVNVPCSVHDSLSRNYENKK